VRIFEGISGIFQDAHFRKRVRIFELSAHLRSRALALHPVPFSRKVVQALVSASIALFSLNLMLEPAERAHNGARRTARRRVRLD
jgi:hypothetical protein